MSTYIVIAIEDYKKPRVGVSRVPVRPFSFRNAEKCETPEAVIEEVRRLLAQTPVYWEPIPKLEAAHEKLMGKKWED